MKFAAERKSYPINLDKPPSSLRLHSAEVTLPKLYGNGLYLLHMLMALKVIRLSKDAYLSFRALYNKPIDEWVVSDIAELETLLNTAQVIDDRKLRLQGLLASFGQQDWLTLKLLGLLHEGGVDYTVLLGPGEVEFISYCEQTKLHGDGFERTIKSQHTPSLNHFIRLANGYFRDKKAELWALIDGPLLSHSKIADTAITGEETEKTTVFTSALVNQPLIDKISANYAEQLTLSDEPTLSKKVDALNQLVREKSREKKLHTLFPDLFSSLKTKGLCNPDTVPLSRLVWSRDSKELQPEAGEHLQFVYDSTAHAAPAPHYINLSNPLGYSNNNQGEITLWHQYCTTKGLITTVETETINSQEGGSCRFFLVHEYKEAGKFSVKTTDQKPTRIPLPANMTGSEAQRRLKHLYCHTSEHPSPEELGSITSPLFWARYPEEKPPVCEVTPTPFKT